LVFGLWFLALSAFRETPTLKLTQETKDPRPKTQDLVFPHLRIQRIT